MAIRLPTYVPEPRVALQLLKFQLRGISTRELFDVSESAPGGEKGRKGKTGELYYLLCFLLTSRRKRRKWKAAKGWGGGNNEKLYNPI